MALVQSNISIVASAKPVKAAVSCLNVNFLRKTSFEFFFHNKLLLLLLLYIFVFDVTIWAPPGMGRNMPERNYIVMNSFGRTNAENVCDSCWCFSPYNTIHLGDHRSKLIFTHCFRLDNTHGTRSFPWKTIHIIIIYIQSL
jgi:hypothetical protein